MLLYIPICSPATALLLIQLPQYIQVAFGWACTDKKPSPSRNISAGGGLLVILLRHISPPSLFFKTHKSSLCYATKSK
jgi:hypothetical protein